MEETRLAQTNTPPMVLNTKKWLGKFKAWRGNEATGSSIIQSNQDPFDMFGLPTLVK